MHYLLTGGYGCIGSWIVRNLIDQGHQVSIYDLAAHTGRMALVMSREEIDTIGFFEGDIADGAAFTRAVGDLGATHIIHLAGLQVPVCRANPVKGAMVNVIGTLNVFEAAKANPGQIHRIVYASSAAVYGREEDYETGPISNDAPLKPLTHYGVYKQCNEGCARVYHVENGISSIGLRPWTVYGPGRDFGLTSDPTKAVKAAVLGRPFVIKFGGRNNMQYVDDTAKIFIRCAEAPYDGAGVYSIRGEIVTVDDIVAAIERAVPQSTGLITHTDNAIPIAPDLDDRPLLDDIGRIPHTPLPEGIAHTAEVFRRHHLAGTLDVSDLT
ncbi:MAG: NAD(P)-dependent oxidoreductase [candidate division Zixibacteria bacterium]|nr:NAD(P)-dependent oxidoreductase [candidate division Zixibacteria bacterium]